MSYRLLTPDEKEKTEEKLAAMKVELVAELAAIATLEDILANGVWYMDPEESRKMYEEAKKIAERDNANI